MPIKVACQCGGSFAVKDEYAGRTLACPKCKQPLKIPAPSVQPQLQAAGPPSAIADLFDEVGLKEHRGARCPQCNTPLKPNAVLCTSCGFHLQTGQTIEGAKVLKSGERGHAEATDSLLERAAKQIEIDKIETKKDQTGGGPPAWVYFIALAMLTGFVVTMFMIPRNQAFYITGACIMGFGALMQTYYHIRMIIAAFQESAACGLMFLFLPFYSLYYLITRWSTVGSFFLMNLAYGVVVWAGIGMMALAPLFEKKEGDGVTVNFPPTQQVAMADEARTYLARYCREKA